MTIKEAEKLAINKLEWQVANGYRNDYSEFDIRYTTEQIHRLTNSYSGGGDVGKTN
jgi:hypothetical protein|nr:hypothetical protein [uncultured Peptostreptococcus sp.]